MNTEQQNVFLEKSIKLDSIMQSVRSRAMKFLSSNGIPTSMMLTTLKHELTVRTGDRFTNMTIIIYPKFSKEMDGIDEFNFSVKGYNKRVSLNFKLNVFADSRRLEDEAFTLVINLVRKLI